MKKLFLILFVLINLLSLSQTRLRDSLFDLVKTPTYDTSTIHNYTKLVRYYLNEGNFKTTDSLNNCIKPIAEKLNYHRGEAIYLSNKGRVAEANGDYSKALEYNYEIISIAEKYKLIDFQIIAYSNMGILYFMQHQLDKALDAYLKANEYAIKANKTKLLGNNYNNIGNVYYTKHDYSKALDYYTLSMEERTKNNDLSGIGNSLNNIGNIYLIENNLEKALEHFQKAEAIQLELNDNLNLIYSYLNEALVYISLKQKNKAKYYLDKGLKLAMIINSLDLNRDINDILARYHEAFKEYEDALKAYKNYISLRDSVNNLTHIEEITKKDLQFEYSKKELENKLNLEKKEIEYKQNSIRQKILIYACLIILLIIIVFSYFLYSRYKVTKHQNIIIEDQKKEVEEKNKEVLDSINYASTIQEALLPAKELKYRLFPNTFILYKPKDVVSGDFYWFGEKNNKKIIAAVDCTGHGVPGSLMSMIGNNFLNELIEQNGITKPSEILNNLKFKIINALKQSDYNRSRDGMDVSMLAFDNNNSTVEFSGANNPLWLIRNNEIIEYNGDKQPVGYYTQEHKSFTNHTIPLIKGDALYIFSDGYADQFGGPKGKKFKYAQLKSLLISICNKPAEEQESILLDSFDKWKSELEQVDDVLIIGIKI